MHLTLNHVRFIRIGWIIEIKQSDLEACEAEFMAPYLAAMVQIVKILIHFSFWNIFMSFSVEILKRRWVGNDAKCR